MDQPAIDDVPTARIQLAGGGDVWAAGEYVLYWMTANRRATWNFALDRAVSWARTLKKPLVVFEALRCDYHWASDRIHRFVIDGMADNGTAFARKPVLYYPYVEPSVGAGKGMLATLAKGACVVVGDDFPAFFLPRMVAAAGRQVSVRFELVDSNGVLPLRATDKVFSRAFDFRRFLQKTLRPHLEEFPSTDPLQSVRLPQLEKLPQSITRRWPAADLAALATTLAKLPIDHRVLPVDEQGGAKAAASRLAKFVKPRLAHYAEDRNRPEELATSGLSPYLHFGHISSHEVFAEIMKSERWSPGRLAAKATGSNSGWWGASEPAEAFLDQLVTWRELGYNMCAHREDYDRYESLPSWAQKTLAEHACDEREYVYALDEFEEARTHDPLWNAAQRQLLREGRIHNYLRMLWGKKILEWSASPQEALTVMIELNNKYALDGRNPNSYSGIFWVLGRYDRAWGPERPVYGKIRYMSSENTARKVRVKGYLERYGA